MPSMPRRSCALACASLLPFLPGVAAAQTVPPPASPSGEVLVIAPIQADEARSASRATITAARAAVTINAVNVEDTLKYLPSLVVRKRHVGDTQAPLATRTSGLGSSARSLIYADGALLSSLIGNNNTIASPRWSMVAPEEIARIDVLYGPYSAAYPGNAIGAVVNITTRSPDRAEATITAATSVQNFDQYDTHRTLPARQLGATAGDRFGPLALFAAATHTTSIGQPLTYVTALRPPTPSAAGVPTAGGFDDVNRTAQPIRVLGASGFEHQRQDNLKLKAALDLSPAVRLTYVAGLFLNDTASGVQSYLSDTASGLPTYVSGVQPLSIGGYPYTLAAGAFDGGVYRYDERHWSHALSATGTGRIVDWQVIGTLYDFAHDVQRQPAGALPTASGGGAGTITRLDGTGWRTIDAKATWRTGTQAVSAGVHHDRFVVDSRRYLTGDWLRGGEGALSQASRGRTRTAAVWAEDQIRLAVPLTLTLGGRYEWWRASDGYNYALAPALAVTQPTRRDRGFSPKASIAYGPAPGWTARLSVGKAYRFPTVGELYQAIATGTVLTVPDPTLKPERALSAELALEHRDADDMLRLSLFDEVVRDALIAQSAVLVPGSSAAFTYVQNVERTRARGIELAVQRSDLFARFDLSGSVTYADATTRADRAFPAAVGRLLPSVPHWKATAVATWHPADAVSLTAAARYAGRNYATIDNSDTVADTYQGFGRYFIVDLRARVSIADGYAFAIGVDNVNNDRYFLFHPFPQRTVHADVTVTL